MASGKSLVLTACARSESRLSLDAALPPFVAGSWVRLRLRGLPARNAWARVMCSDSARGQIVREVFFPPARAGVRETLLHVPGRARTLSLTIFGAAGRGALALDCMVLARPAAALSLLAAGFRTLPAAWRGPALGRLTRLRTALGQAPARAGKAPPYAWWIAHEEQAFPAPRAPDTIPAVVIVGDGPGLAATLDSIRNQTVAPAALRRVTKGEDWPAVGPGDWIVLGPGEILRRDGIAAFSSVTENGAVYADVDRLGAAGPREMPFLKPGPGPLLLASGLLTLGACRFRLIGSCPADLPVEAGDARLILAQRVAQAGLSRLPAILTHISSAPLLAARPSRARHSGAGRTCVLVPSACRDRHVVSCLARVADSLAGVEAEILVGVSSFERARDAVLGSLRRIPRVRLIDLDLVPFNFAEAVNRLAAHATQGSFLLLNDDVSPLPGADWLGPMQRLLDEPGIGIVGARLLYANGLIQHDGVILGLAHLVEHDGRLRREDDDPAWGLHMVDREVSAVTAACMLISASAFRATGGFDPGFAIALNDVDFCLRAASHGWRTAITPRARLIHHESLSLGRHYAGRRASLEAVEIRRFAERWAGLIAADPFYHPLASRELGREWQPGFASIPCNGFRNSSAGA